MKALVHSFVLLPKRGTLLESFTINFITTSVPSSSTLRSSRHLRKSSLAQRLQRAKELQVCYMNDTRLYHHNRRVAADDDLDENETSSGEL